MRRRKPLFPREMLIKSLSVATSPALSLPGRRAAKPQEATKRMRELPPFHV